MIYVSRSFMHKSANSLVSLSSINFCRKATISSLFVPNYRSQFSVPLARNLFSRLKVMAIKEQNFDYFLVLDFEATCLKDEQITPQEIIEFPILKVSGKTFNTEATFHKYVQPVSHPELSSFCTELTGIIQDQVDGQPILQDVLKDVDKWMRDEKLLEPGVRIVFVTCGDWDLKLMLPKQCAHLNIPVPPYFNKWINIKKSFADAVGTYPKGIIDMLKFLHIKHEGRLHSGIDDCKNIGVILKALAEKGFVFKANGHL